MKKLILTFLLGLVLVFPAAVSAEGIFTNEKLITVDTGAQQVTAWQDGKIVYQTKASTGIPQTPTIKGSFKIYLKVPIQRMRGVSKVYGKYDYPNVRYNMYFHQDYGLHHAYWHNNFGRPMSNGCVNLPLAAAEWLYGWSEVGTRVEVY